MFAFLNLVTKKVAFSASIVTSANVFTGPRTAATSSVLIFDKIFTNIGNAYNRKTGMTCVISDETQNVFVLSKRECVITTHTAGSAAYFYLYIRSLTACSQIPIKRLIDNRSRETQSGSHTRKDTSFRTTVLQRM